MELAAQSPRLEVAGPVRSGVASASGSLANIQVLRALAALFVVLYHAASHVSLVRGTETMPIFGERFGLIGVTIFFAISGYLMARLVRTTEPTAFLLHRVARIYPAFLGIVALYGLASPLLGTDYGVDPLALTLAPAAPRRLTLGVEWTLLCETTFYVLLCGLSVAGLGRRVEPFALGWIALIAAFALLAPEPLRDVRVKNLYAILLSPASVAFPAGLLLPWLADRRLLPAWLLPAALPLALAAGWYSLDTNRWLGALAAALVVGTAVQARQVSGRQPLVRIAVRLGDWSYVLYLVHIPVILGLALNAPAAWGAGLVWCIAVGLSLGAAALLGPLDVRAYRIAKRWLDGASLRLRWRLVSLYLALFIAASLFGTAFSALDDWGRVGASRAIATLPADSLSDRVRLERAIAVGGREAPASLAGRAETLRPTSAAEAYLPAWAFDRTRPGAAFTLAILCGGKAVAYGAPSRRRPDVLDGAAGTRRIGFLLSMPLDRCPAGGDILALAVDREGRIKVLDGAARAPGAP